MAVSGPPPVCGFVVASYRPVPGGGMLPVGFAARQVRTPYVTAMSVQKPRDLPAVERSFLREAAQLGARAYYSWGVGDQEGVGDASKKLVEGPSIELALAAWRHYGNCAVEPEPIQETEESWIFYYKFIDLETGAHLTRPFRQSRSWRVYGRFDEERKEDIRFQIGASKAMRNVICNALGALINLGMARAKQGERAKIEAYVKRHGLEAAQAAMMEALAEVQVSPARVLARMGRATVAALTVDDLVTLRGDLKALQLGQEVADHLFPLMAQAKAVEAEAGDGGGATAAAKVQLRRRAGARTPQEPSEASAAPSAGPETPRPPAEGREPTEVAEEG